MESLSWAGHLRAVAGDRPFDLGLGFVLVQSGVSLWLLHGLSRLGWATPALVALAIIAGLAIWVGLLARPRWASMVLQAGHSLAGTVYIVYVAAITYPPVHALQILALASGVVVAACFWARARRVGKDRRATIHGLQLRSIQRGG